MTETKQELKSPSKRVRSSTEDHEILFTPDLFKSPRTAPNATPKRFSVEKEDKGSFSETKREKYKSLKRDLFKTAEVKSEDLEVERSLQKLYQLIHAHSGSLGGGGSGGEIYGELTRHSFHKIMQCLASKCNLGEDSVFLDIGSGLGKPNFHASIYPGVKLSLGIEVQGSRWWQSMNLLYQSLLDDSLQETSRNVYFAHSNVLDLETLDPVTHVYAFNRGMPLHIMKKIANLFNSSVCSRYFICFDGMAKVEKYGFKVKQIECDIQGKMHGSGECHKCYVYEKIDLKVLRQPKKINLRSIRSWEQIKPPTQTKYAPCVPHHASYTFGFMRMRESLMKYTKWVWDQIGFDRSARKLRSTNKLKKFTEYL